MWVAVNSQAFSQEKEGKKVPDVLNFKVKNIDGKEIELSKYQGKVVLIVNVASECGYTGQYEGLQALHTKYAKQGLAILGFPCNDFGGQEPGNEATIKAFCAKEFKVEFDMFAKIKVLGQERAPLYQFLSARKTNPKFAGDVKWNFEKFIIGRDGTIVARFVSDVEPDSDAIRKALEAELAKK
jgi:glutathione peroxidase